MLEINDYLNKPITSLQFQPSDEVISFPKQLFQDIDQLWKSGVDNFDWWHGMLDYWESILFPMISELDMMMRKDDHLFLKVLQYLSRIDFFKIPGNFYTSDIFNLLINLEQNYSSKILESINGISPEQVKSLQDALLENNDVSFRKTLIHTQYTSIIDECRVLLRLGIWQECIVYSIKNNSKNAIIKLFSIVKHIQNMFIAEFAEHKRRYDGIAYYYCLALNKTKNMPYRDDFCVLFGALGEYCHSIILCIYLTDYLKWPNGDKLKIRQFLRNTSTAVSDFDDIKTKYYRRDPGQPRKDFLIEVSEFYGRNMVRSIKDVLQKEMRYDERPVFLTNDPMKKKRKRLSHAFSPWDIAFPSKNSIEQIPPIEELVNALPINAFFGKIGEKESNSISPKSVTTDSSTAIKEEIASSQNICSIKEDSQWSLPKDYFDYSNKDTASPEGSFIPGFLEDRIDFNKINTLVDDEKTANNILSAAFSEMINGIAAQGFIDNTEDAKLNLAYALTGYKVETPIKKIEWKNPKCKCYHINAICYLTQTLHGGKYDFIPKVFLNLIGADTGASRANNVGKNEIKSIIKKFINTIEDKLVNILSNRVKNINTTNLCSHLQEKMFKEDGAYHRLWIAMQDDPELTAVVCSRQLHIYRNGKKVLVLAGKAAPKIIREDQICKLLPEQN